MLTPSKLTILGAAGLLLSALPASAQIAKKPLPNATVQTAVIENSGSTNTFGYKITVTKTKGTYHMSSVSNGGKDSSTDSGMPSGVQPLVSRLFADLNAAMPLTSLPARHGMRSASFGTSTFITYKGQKSPDLTFATDPRATALKADIAAIIKTLGVGNSPRRPLVLHLNKSNTN